jgi:hypothetical protein
MAMVEPPYRWRCPPTVIPMASLTSRGHWTGMAVTIPANCPKPPASGKMGLWHRTHTSGAPTRVGRCTSSVAVPAFTQPALGQVQVVTATGVAVHRTGGSGAVAVHQTGGSRATQVAPRARFRLLFFTFANVLTPPSNHHLVHVC